MMKHNGKTALVIGGSLGGLLTARVLSNHFNQVTILERDAVHNWPESRKGQPHTRHLHGLLAQGLNILTGYFPDLVDGLRNGGSTVADMGKHMRWYCYGDYRAQVDFGMEGVLTSRPFLEWQVRQRVTALPNVAVRDSVSVEKLLANEQDGRVAGVQIRMANTDQEPEALYADLVVDASGRGSHTPKWLAEMGYAKPPESTVTCGVSYASRLYERNPAEPGSQDWVLISPDAPREHRMGGAFPIEGNRWMVSLGSWHGYHAPKDEAGFLAFAKSLPAPDVYQIALRNKPLSDILVHKFPASLRRHYEHLNRFPEGLLVLGDAVCSFNPLYGQGMTSAALQSKELDTLLRERQGALQGIAKPYFKRIARIVDIPWQTAVSEDFRFPETTGRKLPGTDLINAYVAQVHRASHRSPEVGAAFLRVMNLIAPPTSLFHPRIVWHVLRNTLTQRVSRPRMASPVLPQKAYALPAD